MEEIQKVNIKTKKKKKNKELGISKETFNMVRTTYRNNIDLTSIADNKANILLSLNSLMLTILLPMVLGNLNFIIEENLYLPLVALASTSLITIIVASLATRPIKMGKQSIKKVDETDSSPFFFGNYYSMKVDDYMTRLDRALGDPKLVKKYIMLDLYFMGKGLGEKYNRIRVCYNVFIGGIIITVIATVVTVLL